jgi:hypothetical protein
MDVHRIITCIVIGRRTATEVSSTRSAQRLTVRGVYRSDIADDAP